MSNAIPRAGRYRPDIDGLRAIAILAVLAFHAFPAVAPGGFVGVDVFFVISGYLITGLLLADLAADRFSLLDFYRRRIRRIFPALVVVLLACLGYGWFALRSEIYALLGRQVAWARASPPTCCNGPRPAISTRPARANRCCTCGRSGSRSSSPWRGRCCCGWRGGCAAARGSWSRWCCAHRLPTHCT